MPEARYSASASSEALAAPRAEDAEVVSLDERATREAEAELADFRTVAPAVQSFAQGRRR